MTDYNAIPARHDAINLRLEEWARWVRVKPQAWATAPMFRLYRAPRQWATDLEIRIEINTLAAHEIERAVSFLPDKHRSALRWVYVFSYIPDARIRAELGLTREALAGLIHDSRDMLVNRLKQRLVDVG